MGSLRGENARLRQEAEYLRAEIARLGEQNAQLLAILNDFQRSGELVEKIGSAVTDAQGDLITTRNALEAVLALHLDAYGSCTHCRCAHPCSTVVAIETGSQQAREWLWQLRESH